MPLPPEPPTFAARDDYGAAMRDPGRWQPFAREIARQHHLEADSFAGAIPGTNVVLLSARHVIKLYPAMFGGAEALAVESAFHRIAAGLPIPELVATGECYPGAAWSWPYAVTVRTPGVAVSSVWEGLSAGERERAARWCGEVLAALHAIEPPGRGPLAGAWERYDAAMRERRAAIAARHEAWGTLPRHLLGEVEAFLDTTPGRQRGRPAVLHADLHGDHLIGARAPDGSWAPHGVIDFDDAIAGDPFYELPALHIGLFRCDTSLLAAFLDSYGWPIDGEFPRRAMAATLLHQFDVLDDVPGLADCASLDELTGRLWMPGGSHA